MANTVDLKVMFTTILGVFVAIASILLINWMFNKGAERTQGSPRLRKAFFVALAALYAIWMSISIVKVILGKESVEVLLGLPGGALLLWVFLRAGSRARMHS